MRDQPEVLLASSVLGGAGRGKRGRPGDLGTLQRVAWAGLAGPPVPVASGLACKHSHTHRQGGGSCSPDPQPPASDSHVWQAGGQARGSCSAWHVSCSVLGWSPACEGDPGRGRHRPIEQHPGPHLLGHRTGPPPLVWPGCRQGDPNAGAVQTQRMAGMGGPGRK